MEPFDSDNQIPSDFSDDDDFLDNDDDFDPQALAEFQEAARKLANADDPKTISKLNTIDSLNKNIDDELETLIAQDKLAEAPAEEHKENVNDVTVYEGEAEEKKIVLVPFYLPGIGEQKTKEVIAQVNAMPVRAFVLMFAALIATIVGSGLFLVMNVKSMNDPATQNIAGPVIEQPKSSPNSTNFMYIKESNVVGGKETVLTKMVADSLATVFYFDQPIDTDQYYVTLSDNNRELYTLDSTDATEETEPEDAVLRFSPLKEGAAGVALSICDTESGETAVYEYALKEPVSFAPARYLNEAVDLALPEGLGAKIVGASFSTTGSTVYFGFTANENGEMVTLKQSRDKTGVALEESVGALRPSQAFPTTYTFDDQVIGRMDFAPVKNLNGQLTVTFDSLFKEVPLSKTVQTAGLFSNMPETEQRLDAGGHEIVLERMGVFDDKCLLILHSEKKGAVDPATGQPERTEVLLDTELLIEKEDGGVLAIPGKGGSVKEGTDIIFELGDFKEEAAKLPPGNFTVRIKGAQLKLDDVSVTISGGQSTPLSAQTSAAQDGVLAAMAQRLQYKSGELPMESINGFSEDVLKNGAVMGNYAPNKDISEARYSTEVLACAADGDRINLVVAETWQGLSPQKELNFSRTHKITADYTDGKWMITKDSIV